MCMCWDECLLYPWRGQIQYYYCYAGLRVHLQAKGHRSYISLATNILRIKEIFNFYVKHSTYFLDICNLTSLNLRMPNTCIIRWNGRTNFWHLKAKAGVFFVFFFFFSQKLFRRQSDGICMERYISVIIFILPFRKLTIFSTFPVCVPHCVRNITFLATSDRKLWQVLGLPKGLGMDLYMVLTP